MATFWYRFSSPGILKIAIPFDTVVVFSGFRFLSREPTRVPSGTSSGHLFGSLLEPFDLILVPLGRLWTPLWSLWEVLGLMFFQLLELLELSRSVSGTICSTGFLFGIHFSIVLVPR